MSTQAIKASDIVVLIDRTYCHEPCRICGDLITEADLPELVFAGYSECNTSRTAHGNCWRNQPVKSNWSFPVDAVSQE